MDGRRGRNMKITVDPVVLARFLEAKGKRFIQVREIAEMLGTSTRSAGKIMAELERRGYVRRYSRRVFEFVRVQRSGSS